MKKKLMVDNKDIVRRYFEALDGGHPEEASALFTQDCQIHRPERPGPLVGNEAIYRIVAGTCQLYSEFQTEIHDMIQEGERVAVRITHRAVGRGDWETRIGTFSCADKPTRWDAIVVFVLRDGKIAEEYVMRDELGMLLSVGALRPRA